MANNGNPLRDAVEALIKGWGAGLEVLHEVNVGYRFINTPRRMDLVIRNPQNNRTMAIECKCQTSGGTADEKLIYALEDCKSCPIPTIIVFAGDAFKPDLKARLVLSGLGIEVKGNFQKRTKSNGKQEKVLISITDEQKLLQQRCYIELGLDWFPIATGQEVSDQLAKLRSSTSSTP